MTKDTQQGTLEMSQTSKAAAGLVLFLLLSLASALTGCQPVGPADIPCLENSDCPASYFCGVTRFCAVIDTTVTDAGPQAGVPGAPGAPTNVLAAPGNAQATVMWTPPLNPGLSPITKYIVTSSPGGQNVNITAGTQAVVTGLINGTTYVFAVSATNRQGLGVSSAPSNAITPSTVPGAPQDVNGVPGDMLVTLTWAPPASNGGSPITSYTVTSNPGGPSVNTAGTSAAVTGLTNGTPYTFTIVATNADGKGTPSPPTAPIIPGSPPGAPSAVTATAGNGQATVSWAPPANSGGSPITGYMVTPSSGGSAVSAPATATSAIVTGLMNGTSYAFSVVAMNAIGTGSTSNPSNVVTPAGPPAAPTNVAAVPGNGQATVSWTPASANGSPITSYTVTASTGGATATTSGATTVAVAGLTDGTAYAFTVVATNAAGTSPASASSAPVIPANIPGPPTNVVATSADGAADVTWIAPADDGGSAITGYTVTPYDQNGAPGGPVSVTGTMATVSPLINAMTYTFAVCAKNAVGTGVCTDSNPATPGQAGPPTALTATAGDQEAFLTWTAPASTGGSEITGYSIMITGGMPEPFPLATSAAVTGLTNGETYTFQVAAVNANGTGLWSQPSNAVIPECLVPDAPMVSAVPGVESATVNWSAPDDNGCVITGYTVELVSGAFEGTTAANNLTVNGLQNGTAYAFQVFATNSAGNGPLSMPSNAAIVGAPGVPTSVQASPGVGSATVSWSAPDDPGASAVNGYDVATLYPDGGVVSSDAGFIVAGGSPVTIAGLANGATYAFSVVATNSYGAGPAAISAPVTLPGLPDPPTSVMALPTAEAAIISWTAPANTGGSPVIGYTILASTGAGTASTTGATTATVSGLTPGTTYTFTVSATTAVGNGPASASSNAVIPTGAPVSMSLVASPTTVIADGVSASTLTLAVTDGNGSPVPNYPVSMTDIFVGSVLTPSWGATGMNGTFLASFSSTHLGTATVSATAGTLSRSVQVTFSSSPCSQVFSFSTDFDGADAGTSAPDALAIPDFSNGQTALADFNGDGVGDQAQTVSPHGSCSLGEYTDDPAWTGCVGVELLFGSRTGGFSPSPAGSTYSYGYAGLVYAWEDSGIDDYYDWTQTVLQPFLEIAGNYNGSGLPSVANTGGYCTDLNYSSELFQSGFQCDSWQPLVSVLPGAAGGTLGPSGSTALIPTSDNQTPFLAAGDWNRDELTDLIVPESNGGASPTVGFFEGTSSGLSASTTTTLGAAAVLAAPGDFNGDGNLDLAIVDSLGNVEVLTGDGSGGFSLTATIPFPETAIQQIVAGDFNGDGRLDLLATGRGASPSVTLLNSCAQAGVPSAPEGVTATGGVTSATVSWSAPSSAGGSPITGYVVFSGHSGTSGTTTGATTATVTAPGGTNQFYVYAVNAIGNGPAAAAPSVVVGLPGAPTGVTATLGSCGTSGCLVTIAWTIPAVTGSSPITLYAITPSTGSTVYSASTSTSILETEGTYTYTVTAANSVGTGPASAPSPSVNVP